MATLSAKSEASAAVAEQVEQVKEASDRFNPAWYLPVKIDFVTNAANPYSLTQSVVYNNGVVHVELPQGFQWDGASIPPWLPVVPWILTIVAMQFWPGPWLWFATAILVAYTIRLLPYMQKMGLHARSACVHDALYRTQTVARVVADAIMVSIMESDGVPWDVRTIIYRRVRHFGWIAWRLNARANAKAAKVEGVGGK